MTYRAKLMRKFRATSRSRRLYVQKASEVRVLLHCCDVKDMLQGYNLSPKEYMQRGKAVQC